MWRCVQGKLHVLSKYDFYVLCISSDIASAALIRDTHVVITAPADALNNDTPSAGTALTAKLDLAISDLEYIFTD